MNLRRFVVLALVVSLWVAAAPGVAAQEDEEGAQVRVAHFSVDAGPLHAYVNGWVVASDGSLLAENDNLAGLNAGLQVELEAGTYIIEAGSFLDTVSGAYELIIRAVE